MRRHSLFDEFDESLAATLPCIPVEVAGQWRLSTRRCYRESRQLGTGAGPFVEVMDACWQGSLTCAEPVVGLAFFATPTGLYWAKTASVGPSLDVTVSLSAYSDYSPQRATFTARVADAGPPGVSVACGLELREVCTLHEGGMTTARVEPLAHTKEATFAVVLLPQRHVAFGRHRLWRVRADIASSLPQRVRDILTRSRTGYLS